MGLKPVNFPLNQSIEWRVGPSDAMDIPVEIDWIPRFTSWIFLISSEQSPKLRRFFFWKTHINHIIYIHTYTYTYTIYNIQCTMYNVQCTMYNVQCTMYNTYIYIYIYIIYICLYIYTYYILIYIYSKNIHTAGWQDLCPYQEKRWWAVLVRDGWQLDQVASLKAANSGK